MTSILINMIMDRASEFGSIASRVNASSKKRKGHAEAAHTLVLKAHAMGKGLQQKMKHIARVNFSQRNQDSVVLNYCEVIRENITEQKRIIDALKNAPGVDAGILSEIEAVREELLRSLNEAMPLLEKIIDNDNSILLKDAILLEKKAIQMDSLSRLKKLVERSLNDSQKAIDGSGANLARGTKMVSNIRKVKEHINKRDIKAIRDLAREARRGWQTACTVNQSSRLQAAFADSVQQFTGELVNDSNIVGNLVFEKHNFFEANLQDVTVLTIVLAVKMKKYLAVEKKAAQLQGGGRNNGAVSDLKAYISCACRDIAFITALNYDTTDVIRANNEMETATVAVTKKEMECFNAIIREVNAMTEVTRYPVEGSECNITNGKMLENALKQLVE